MVNKKIIVASLLMIVGMSTVCTFAADSETAFQSVVQVVSYDAIYGKYPVMRGWGSASIISSDGVILTNNHVVSKENGSALTNFAICISTSISSRPDCKYTASLITKHEDKDLALLRIDPIDINGIKVDFTKLVPLNLDMSYIPKGQDKTLAIGYPSVGADTITQTIGVVAGTQQYNDLTYIKTDTAIAPGNSGGPLLKDGKVIGVNTFTIGDSSSLGYALLIGQAKSFIDDNITKKTISSSISSTDFQAYLKRAEQIQIDKKMSDNIFSVSFTKPYVVTNYIPGLQLAGTLQTPDTVNVSSFSLSIKNTLDIHSADDMLYLLKKDYGYNPKYHTLQKELIGGLTMYSFVSATDLSQGENDNYKYYIAQYGSSSIIELVLSLPSLDDATKQNTIKNNIQLFLSGIQFTTGQKVLSSQKIVMSHPALTLTPLKGMFTNIIDTNYNTISSFGSYTTPFAVLPFKNIHENITYTLIHNSIELGSTKSLEDKFNITTEGIPSTQKTLISYNGHPGYALCLEQSTDAFSYEDHVLTKQGAVVEMGLCRVVLYVGDEEDTILQIDLNVEKSKLKGQQRKLLTVIKSSLVLDSVGDGKTTLPLHIMQSKQTVFTDTQDQSDAFNSYLSLLSRYGILPKSTKVGLETPMTYKSYLALYLKAVYNIAEDKTDSILKSTGINPDAYVDVSTVGLFKSLVSLRLAGIELPGYASKDLIRFQLLSQSTYRSDRKRIEAFDYSIYGSTTFGIDSILPDIASISYFPYISYYFDPITGLKPSISYNDKGSLSTPSFGFVSNGKQQDLVIQCSHKPSMDKACMKFYKELANTTAMKSDLGYPVLLLGAALDDLSEDIDIGLFDTQWAAKK